MTAAATTMSPVRLTAAFCSLSAVAVHLTWRHAHTATEACLPYSLPCSSNICIRQKYKGMPALQEPAMVGQTCKGGTAGLAAGVTCLLSTQTPDELLRPLQLDAAELDLCLQLVLLVSVAAQLALHASQLVQQFLLERQPLALPLLNEPANQSAWSNSTAGVWTQACR